MINKNKTILTPTKLLILCCIVCNGCRNSKSQTKIKEVESIKTTSPEIDRKIIDERAYNIAIKNYFKEQPATTLLITHDSLNFEDVYSHNPDNDKIKINIQTPKTSADGHLENVDALLQATNTKTLDNQKPLIFRIDPSVNYETFSWTLYALGKRESSPSHLFVEATQGKYHAIPFVYPRLTFSNEDYPSVALHNSDECSERTLIRLGATDDGLTTCLQKYGKEQRAQVKLYTSAKSNQMLHSYVRDADILPQLKACLSAELSNLKFSHELSKKCRPSLSLMWRTGHRSDTSLTMAIHEKGIDLAYQGGHISRCDGESWPRTFCLSPEQQARSNELLKTWEQANRNGESEKARIALNELKSLWDFPGFAQWFQKYHFETKPDTNFGPLELIVAAHPSMPVHLVLHTINQVYHDRQALWWDDVYQHTSLFRTPVWAILQ